MEVSYLQMFPDNLQDCTIRKTYPLYYTITISSNSLLLEIISWQVIFWRAPIRILSQFMALTLTLTHLKKSHSNLFLVSCILYFIVAPLLYNNCLFSKFSSHIHAHLYNFKLIKIRFTRATIVLFLTSRTFEYST